MEAVRMSKRLGRLQSSFEFLPSHGSGIICRKCGGLSYESENEPRHFRALRKAQKIRVRLGGSADVTGPFPSRPRYMHRRTYQCLRRRYEAAVEQYLGAMALRL